MYKTGILIISKLSNGVLYGLLAGTAVFVIFYIPVQQFILAPETARTLAEMESPRITQAEASQEISNNIVNIMIGSLITHLVGYALVINGCKENDKDQMNVVRRLFKCNYWNKEK